MKITDTFQQNPQMMTAHTSQDIAKSIPHSFPTLSKNKPIIEGLGKSPRTCIKNTDKALACPLRCTGTQFIVVIDIGDVTINKNTSLIPKSIKKMITLPGLETHCETNKLRIPIIKAKTIEIGSKTQDFSTTINSSFSLVSLPFSQ
jgi:hypothetical protein